MVVTFSSVCLAPTLLSGVEPVLGIGAAIVRKRFLSPFGAGGLRAEADLPGVFSRSTIPGAGRMVQA
jgi:hypothetical protein